MKMKRNEKDPTPEFQPKTSISKAVSWLEWTDLMSASADWCEPEWVDAETELFMLYTSIHNAPGLPKTRSGKIMRRVLRKIARNDHELGDTSTMADTSVVEQLFSITPVKF
eukprot:TRINITY_DN566_c0_g1_i4.p2 TRINITY_DN566_c0_g1~~TRINITY_DN566_c0_g1_i4.p2  ORF type:complete len:111 (+),score=34.98 TRINITY_DN566_c0_g1_i4:913-1245(+)